MDNRYTVLKVHPVPKRTGYLDRELILAQIHNPSGLPYVIWCREVGTNNTFNGEYFEYQADAESRFQARSKVQA